MKNKSRAFTLIELLVVVLIIGILAAVALPQYQKAVDNSRFTQLLIVSKAIKDAQEVYYMTNGTYATSLDELSVKFDSTKIHIQLKSCSAGQPASSYIRYDNLPGVLFISGYKRQCSENGWADSEQCYAESANARANRVCANWAHTSVKTGCEAYCVYSR